LPTDQELERFYSQLYYQENLQCYTESYSKDEIRYFENEARTSEYIFKKHCRIINTSLLDIGCGEGYFSKYFHNKRGWAVSLIDYSSFGLEQHNSQLLESFYQGDIFDKLIDIHGFDKKFHLINIKNVIEHVADPGKLIQLIKKITEIRGLIRIEVPNDYSKFQDMLIEYNKTNNTWFKPPEHLHYFNKQSLLKFIEMQGLEIVELLCDFPIEMFVLNDYSNYTRVDAVGKQAHLSRVIASNYLMEQGIENAVMFYRSLAQVDFGRQLIACCKISEN